jgi:hypothetical protein
MSARQVQATHNKVMVGRVERSPGVWQIRTTVATFDLAGKLVARLQRYQTFRGDHMEAEAERIRVLWRARGMPNMDSKLDLGSGITIRDWAHAWLREKEREQDGRVSKETLRVRRSRVVNHVIPAWGDYALGEFDWRDVAAGWQWFRHQGLSTSTSVHATSLLTAIVTDAAEHGLAYLPDCQLQSFRAERNGA